ncbi:MAG: hypothetical protein J0L92_34535, partial [Deltaproteobacteria bacterium]|nr:hypothetical protein [Deltaproteobacteria bacterium]
MSSDRRDSTMEVLLDEIEDNAGTTQQNQALTAAGTAATRNAPSTGSAQTAGASPRKDASTGIRLDRDLDALLDGPSATTSTERASVRPPPPPSSATSPGLRAP